MSNDLRNRVLTDKYYLRDGNNNLIENTEAQLWERVSNAVASVEPKESRKKWQKQFYWLLEDWKFVPGGRILFGAGNDRSSTLLNCYYIPITADSIEGIYKCLYEVAKTLAGGGGCGIDMSIIRPAKSVVHNSAMYSSGVVPIIEQFSHTAGLIGQHGRIGALIATLHCAHPDIFEFVKCKADVASNRIKYANISVFVSNKLMEAVKNDSDFSLWYPDKVDVVPENISNLMELIQKECLTLKEENLEDNKLMQSFKDGTLLWKYIDVYNNMRQRYKERGIAFIYSGYDSIYNYEDAEWFVLYSPINNCYEVRKRTVRSIVKAVDLWNSITEHARNCAEPGVLFYDNMKKRSTTEYNGMEVMGVNPCLCRGSLVLTKDGLVPIEKLVDIKKFEIWNGERWAESKAWYTGNKKVYEITLSNGLKIKTTGDHKLFLGGEWCEAKDSLGKEYEYQFGNEWVGSNKFLNITDDELILAGFIQGDGGLRKDCGGICICVGGKDDEIIKLLPNGYVMHSNTDYYYGSNSRIVQVCDCLGMIRVANYDRSLPIGVFSLPQNKLKLFLKGLFSANGCALQKTGRIKLRSINREMINQVQVLLTALGYKSYVTTVRGKVCKWKNGDYKSNDSYDLNITGMYSRIFVEDIGFVHSYKNENIKNSFKIKHINRRKVFVKSVECVGMDAVYDFEEKSLHCGWVNGFKSHNCSETVLSSYGCCCLSSINLSAVVSHEFTNDASVDYKLLEEIVRTGVRFLDNVLDCNRGRHPLLQQEDEALKSRRIGLGVTGLADMLCKLKLKYDTNEAIIKVDEVISFIKSVAYDASVKLGEEKGSFPAFDPEKHFSQPFYESLNHDDWKKPQHLRNSALLSMPPVGSGSLLTQTSSGIEPIFAISYDRKFESLSEDKFKVYHPLAQAYMKKFNITKEQDLPNFFVVADKIDYKNRVAMQATIQNNCCQSISSTCNVSSDTTKEIVKQIYELAWGSGCKGITVYRQGSRQDILSVSSSAPAKKPRTTIINGNTIKVKVQNDHSVYVTLNKDADGNLMEVFVNLGKSGSDAKATAEALGRLVSLYLQSGGQINRVIETLIDIKGDAVHWWDGMTIFSLPDAVAKALMLLSNATIEWHTQCPKCKAHTLRYEGGCWACSTCGHSKC